MLSLSAFKNQLKKLTLKGVKSDAKILEELLLTLKGGESLSEEDINWCELHVEPGQQEKLTHYLQKLATHPGIIELHKLIKSFKKSKRNLFSFTTCRTQVAKGKKIARALRALPIEDLGHIGNQEYARTHKPLLTLHQALAYKRTGESHELGTDNIQMTKEGDIDVSKARGAFTELLTAIGDTPSIIYGE